MSRILALTFHNYMTVKRLLTAASNLQVLMLSHILLSSSRSIQPQYVKKVLKKRLNQQYNNPSTPGARQHCEHSLCGVLLLTYMSKSISSIMRCICLMAPPE